MKRLNKKGFTLIELLAVIVILAVVMVITIPSVLNSMSAAKSGQLQNAADVVSKWLTDNYEISLAAAELGTGTMDSTYASAVGTSAATYWNTSRNIASLLQVAGVADPGTNISTAYAIKQGNKICVTLTANSGGSFYVNDGTNKATSKGCTEVSAS